MENKIRLDRVSTNFALQLFEHLKALRFDTEAKSPYAFLKYHQNIVREFINDVNIDSRGLLVYHTPGTGKTLIGVATCMDLLTDRQPIILLTKSLQSNFKKDEPR